MTDVDFACINYEHGGLKADTTLFGSEKAARHFGEGFGYDHTGLVRIMGENGRWPDLFVVEEADRYKFNGGRGAWEAIEAMATDGGRNYAWLPCSLPREAGPFAPAIFYDPQTVRVKRFYPDDAPDFAARVRNLLIINPVAGGEQMFVLPWHGDGAVPALRTQDAEALRPLLVYCPNLMILGDFNEPLSGPRYQPSDLNDDTIYNLPHGRAGKVEYQRGRPTKPYRRSTGSTDYLCGWQDESTGGLRVDGIGMHSVCELAGINTPTDLPTGREGTQLDLILINEPLIERVVPGSTRVHDPIDREGPDSDHKRVSVALELGP